MKSRLTLSFIVLSRYFHMSSRFAHAGAFQKAAYAQPNRGLLEARSRSGLRRAPEPVHPPSTSPLGEFATTTVVSPSCTCACARARVGTYSRDNVLFRRVLFFCYHWILAGYFVREREALIGDK